MSAIIGKEAAEHIQGEDNDGESPSLMFKSMR